MSRMRRILKRVKRFLSEKEIVGVPMPMAVDHMLEGKVALVVGGDGGIGNAIAGRMACAGAKLIIAGRNETKIEACCDQLNARWGG